eukprot:gene8886-13774_t
MKIIALELVAKSAQEEKMMNKTRRAEKHARVELVEEEAASYANLQMHLVWKTMRETEKAHQREIERTAAATLTEECPLVILAPPLQKTRSILRSRSNSPAHLTSPKRVSFIMSGDDMPSDRDSLSDTKDEFEFVPVTVEESSSSSPMSEATNDEDPAWHGSNSSFDSIGNQMS